MMVRFRLSLAQANESFAAGSIYDLPEDQATRFINEGVAERAELKVKLNFILNIDYMEAS